MSPTSTSRRSSTAAGHGGRRSTSSGSATSRSSITWVSAASETSTRAVAALEPDRLRPLSGMGDRDRHDGQRCVLGEAHVGYFGSATSPGIATCRRRNCCRPCFRTSPTSGWYVPTRSARRSRSGRPADCDLAGGRLAPRASAGRDRRGALTSRPTSTSSRSTARSCASTTARSPTSSTRSSSRRPPGTRSWSTAAPGRCSSSTSTSRPTLTRAVRTLRLG